MAKLINGQGAPQSDDWRDLPRFATAPAPQATDWVLAPPHDIDAQDIDLNSLAGCVGIELNFPDFVDGRAYSQASTLRLKGYAGPLRAIGDVLIDQLYLMRRCGFDQFALNEQLNLDDARTALAQFKVAAQPARDDRELRVRLAPAPASTSL